MTGRPGNGQILRASANGALFFCCQKTDFHFEAFTPADFFPLRSWADKIFFKKRGLTSARFCVTMEKETGQVPDGPLGPGAAKGLIPAPSEAKLRAFGTK